LQAQAEGSKHSDLHTAVELQAQTPNAENVPVEAAPQYDVVEQDYQENTYDTQSLNEYDIRDIHTVQA
jgi:hypothetical protein